jgi:hypothetical protein
MNRSSIFSKVAIVALLAALSIGCKPEETDSDDVVSPETKTLTVDASAFEKWAYVSFVQGKEVVISDTNFATDLSWDIALHRMDVRLNGGASGKGQGAALKTTQTALSAVTTIATSGFSIDELDSINISMTEKVEQPKNLLLSSWITMSGAMPPIYRYEENVYIVKTAEGKHVKLKFLDYKNAEDKGGFVKFSYVYMD